MVSVFDYFVLTLSFENQAPNPMKPIVPSSRPWDIFGGVLRLTVYLVIMTLSQFSAFSQCPGGYTQTQVNWDELDFLPSTGSAYTTFYLSAAFPYNQNFAAGP